MGDDNKVFSYDEVSVHNTSKDCWVIINAKAYNVTSFLDDHPGGGDVLLEAAGKDASEEFEAAGHGSAARLMLDEYYAGEIDPSTNPNPIAATPSYMPPKQLKDDNNEASSVPTILRFLPVLLSLAILGFAAIIQFYKKSGSNSMQ